MGEHRTVTIPTGSIYDLQRSVNGVEVLACLATEAVSEKKSSRWTEAAFHPVRPWLAAMDSKGRGIVWNWETMEVVVEFSLDMGQNDATAAGAMDAHAAVGVVVFDEELGAGMAIGGSAGATGGVVGSTGVASPARISSLLQRAASPALAYRKPTRSSRASPSLRMLFYDHEAIQWMTKTSGHRTCFDDLLVVVTATHVMFCDINHPNMIRSVPSDDLQRQAPCSACILPSGMLAIGCLDGKVRVWDPSQRRTMATIDAGSTKEVQHLLLCVLGTGERSSSPGATLKQHFLIAATLDSRITTWVVAPSGQCTPVPGAIEIKDVHRAFDTSVGLTELTCHAQQNVMTATARDGSVYFFDLFPLLLHQKPMVLSSVLPSPRLTSVFVLAGHRKGAFSVVSVSPQGTTLLVSELVNKGRATSKEIVNPHTLEFALASSLETKDLRPLYAMGTVKKIKTLALTGSARTAGEFCCVTSVGLVVVRALGMSTVAQPVMITRDAPKPPVVLLPGPSRVSLRLHGVSNTSAQQSEYKLQGGADAPNEMLRIPILEKCPCSSGYVSASLPASAHVEILQLGSELRNQKSVDMSLLFSGTAIAIAWHATEPRFALLVPQEPEARRLARASSTTSVAPRLRGFKFGNNSSSKASSEDAAAAAAAEAKARNSLARAMTLIFFEITGDDQDQVQVVADRSGFQCGDDRILHIFSGPLLGVVKYVADDGGAPSKRIPSTAVTARSPMAVTATSGEVNAPESCFSFPCGTTSDLRRTSLEFYEWNAVHTSNTGEADAGPSASPLLQRVGSAALECPLFLAWESVTHRFCALVYARCVKIYRITSNECVPASPITCLHEIPTETTVRSLLWMHHTLFFLTEDKVQCCIMSRTRFFVLDLGSRFEFVSSATLSAIDSELAMRTAREALTLEQGQFPVPQALPEGTTALLGISDQRLLLASPTRSVGSLALHNRVLQCLHLISLGHADQALQVAETLASGHALADWVGSVLEAFTFVDHALRLSRMSLSLKINVAIKHARADELVRLLQSNKMPPSPDLTGSSLFQLACIALHRSARRDDLTALCQQLMTAHSSSAYAKDAVFIATLLRSDELLTQALRMNQSWGPAYLASKRSGVANKEDALSIWNEELRSATATWKTALERRGMQPPSSITFLAKP